ncbi:MAG: ABC transporter permease [Methylobacteriaceae bacterium]|nr:ABC transporter permease [Methylobacteriaceae bacterium]
MSAFLFRRVLMFLATLIGASVVIFVVLEVLPGNAAQTMLGPDATPQTVAALAHKLGLDRPPVERYVSWIAGLAHGDFGLSYAYGTPIADLIENGLAVSLPLALLAMLLTTALALGLGILAAAHHRRLGDLGAMTLSQVGIAVPNFWLAILLILFFAVRLRWFAAGGFPGWDAGVGPALKALVLPAVALAAVQAAILTRVIRAAVLDVMREDFVRTARAKGLSRAAVLWRHVLRNALIPVVTIMGLQFANLVAGTVVVENVFYLPGLGRLVFQSIANRDGVVVRDAIMLLVVMVVAVNFLIDILYLVIDPRLRARR